MDLSTFLRIFAGIMNLSIIIPVYNVEKYIRRCIESVMAQNTADAKIECILVDDCTPDDSMRIAKEMTDAYQGPITFRMLHHDVNRGLSAARNTGLNHASGDYIFFMDSDDWIEPDTIRYFQDQMAAHPDAEMVIGNVLEEPNGKRFLGALEEPRFIDDHTVFTRLMLQEKIYRQAWNKLIRKDILTTHHLTFMEGIVYEDLPWTFELFLHIKSVLLLPYITYHYECNETSVVHTSFHLEKADRAVRSFTLGVSRIQEIINDPIQDLRPLQVDCILYMTQILNKAADIYIHAPIQGDTKKQFKKVRSALLRQTLSNGRIVLTTFLLSLFPPFWHLQRLRWYRRHYYAMEQIASRISHMTDFLHYRVR